MNKVRMTVSIILLSLGYQYVLYCATHDYIVTFFIQPYPDLTVVPEEKSKKAINNAAKNHKISYKIIKNTGVKVNQGIIALYFGFASISDRLGQVIFPRFVQKPSFNLLITEKIKPVFMVGNTIHHWEVIPHIPARMYHVEKKQDSHTKLWYWDVKETSLPSHNLISFDTITILAKPTNIVVPVGVTLTSDDPQLVLPTIYVTKNNNSIMDALYYLTINSFFSSVNQIGKKQKDTYFSTLINA